MKHVAYIGFGANLGEREAQCRRALALLDKEPGIRVRVCSPLYLTEPVGMEGAEWFINGAAALETTLSPEDLLNRMLRIEAEMGRDRSQPLSPRTIDLDLLFYNDRVVQRPGLIIPHPHIQERRFVLSPLNSIAADYVHPVLKQTVAQLLDRCQGDKHVQLLGE